MTFNYEGKDMDSRILRILRLLDRYIVVKDRNELEAYIRAFACPKEAYKDCDKIREHGKCRKCWDGDGWI